MLLAISRKPCAATWDLRSDESSDAEHSYVWGSPPTGIEIKIRSMDDQPLYAGTLQKALEFIGLSTSGALDDMAGDSVMLFVGTKP